MTPEEYAEIRDAYKPLAAARDFEDYGPALVPEGTFEYLGKYVRLSEITDKQVVSLIASQFVQTCAQARAAGVPYTSEHIANLIAETLVKHGGFHRSSECFNGMEPQKALPPGKTMGDLVRDDDPGTPLYDQLKKDFAEDEEETIGLEDMVGWLKEGLFLAGGGDSYTDVTNPEEAVIDGVFNLEEIAEHMMLHIWNDEGDDE